MKKPTNIAHPLKKRTGSSQGNRRKEALSWQYAPIDTKTLADRLYFISQYAKLVNFFDVKTGPDNKEYQEVSNWTDFFENSLPFRLANFSKTSPEDLQNRFSLLYQALRKNPSPLSLEALLNFIYHEVFLPVANLFAAVEQANNSFSTQLLAMIKSSYQAPLIDFIALYNASRTFLCITGKNFKRFLQPPWQLSAKKIYALEPCIQKVKKGKNEAYLLAGEMAGEIFDRFMSSLEEIIETSPNYIHESLVPLEASLQQKHEPHLALLFGFLKLYEHLQKDINSLSKKHLDFFFKRVLQLKPAAAVPDKAHLVFEPAKHLTDGYLLPEDLLLKDGKDSNKQDIVFGLDQELVIDKAKIAGLRSFSLHPTKDHNSNQYIEGAYIAPVANSRDGKGEKFKEDGASWATLGGKYSKLIREGHVLPEEHPPARLGFVLSSPVLLLQEGRRDVTITLDCNLHEQTPPLSPTEKDELKDRIEDKLNVPGTEKLYLFSEFLLIECDESLAADKKLSLSAKNYIRQLLARENPVEVKEQELDDFFKVRDFVSCEPIFSENDKEQLKECLDTLDFAIKNKDQPLFKVSLSGEKGWIMVRPKIKILKDPPTGADIQIEIIFQLAADVPAVVSYNEENLKEKLDLKDTIPAVKIELNENLKVSCPAGDRDEEKCCLKHKPEPSGDIFISPYHFLRKLQITNARIDVDVCGVKNLIVQNDAGTLDINSQIYPFGIRPEVPGFDPMNQVDLGPPADPNANPELFLGPSFYIGSKEVLYKKWEAIRVNMEWKEKPHDFHDHYKAYLKHKPDVNDPPAGEHFGLFEGDFKVKIDLLDLGNWTNIDKIKLFSEPDPGDMDFKDLDCAVTKYAWEFTNDLTDRYIDYEQPLDLFKNSQNGFLKFTLADQDFLHKEYAFVLARQMLAYAFTGENKKLADAIYVDDSSKIVISPFVDFLNEAEIIEAVNDLTSDLITVVKEVFTFIENNEVALKGDVAAIKADIESAKTTLDSDLTQYFNDVVGAILDFAASFPAKQGEIITTLDNIATGSAQTAIDNLNVFLTNLKDKFTDPDGIDDLIAEVEQAFEDFHNLLDDTGIFNFLYGKGFQALIPKEPWTPIIKNLFLDYSAKANMEDINIIHLYPFENTSRFENLEKGQTLFPYFTDRGSLLVGLKEITPGGTLSLLFQLAEASADSETDRADINWHYLTNNNWQPLRPNFDIISDDTDGLTVSGIVTIAIPGDISNKGHTIMPDDTYWLKVSSPSNIKAIAETIDVHTQAALASARIQKLNDKDRLKHPLPAGSISKQVNSDFNVKKVEQRYDSFGGNPPEVSGHFYVRASEYLRHKGRGIMITDHEKIILEAFPEIYKVKCISHTMGLPVSDYRRDLEIAPGYLIIAVIPDLTKLKAGNQLSPKAPVSLLDKIGDHLRRKISPFARVKVMNPRYEPINVDIEVRLYRGKSQNYYAQKLREEISQFLAPWFMGESEKLAFGQEVFFSDLVDYVESRGYVDFILDIRLSGECEQAGSVIKPLTARSILTSGEVCVKINKEECQKAGNQEVLIE
ncbi:hypothetical protein KUV50_01070 [Membranicola marinus]|uniref:Baseplate J-like protein n=1 Tax=Membranihabitans marinus TaxID=1227546 RepID=A0A953HR02_9BACT|nr:hypothetical protein [Membranihabitans marinus]MBY5956706.1 hypothetical protein [Membranihabitans marinus]